MAAPASPGDVRDKESPAGHRHGSKWLPAECDVSIRPGWFWHERENARVKTEAQLADLYYKSVGRGANLLLNVPPNRDGLLGPEDVAALKAFGDYRRKTFAKSLAAGAKVSAGARALVEGREDSWWAAPSLTPEVTIDLPRPATFQVIRVKEAIRFGQRIDGVAVDRWESGEWRPVAAASSIGPRRLIRLDNPVTAARLRLRVTQAAANPVLSEFALFAE